MSKRKCYFQCIYDGQLYGFPPPSYTNYEKFCKWKNVLRKIDQEKDNLYIAHNIKLCSNHFEKHYFAVNHRLTRHAIPTLNLGLNRKQEYFFCSFIEKNAKLIMNDHLQGETLDLLRAVWKMVTPKLNSLGPMKSYSGWAEYLNDVMANLKTKEVRWIKEGNTLLLKNCDDFTKLELKILQLWNNKDSELDHKSIFSDENDPDMELVFEVDEVEDNMDDNNIDSNIDGDIGRHINSHKDRKTETRKEIMIYSLYVGTGGDTPLLQAADITPCKRPQYTTNVVCQCKNSDGEQDEFEAFGNEIAHELRNMPTEAAVETQRQLMSILRSKQRKLIYESFL